MSHLIAELSFSPLAMGYAFAAAVFVSMVIATVSTRWL